MGSVLHCNGSADTDVKVCIDKVSQSLVLSVPNNTKNTPFHLRYMELLVQEIAIVTLRHGWLGHVARMDDNGVP